MPDEDRDRDRRHGQHRSEYAAHGHHRGRALGSPACTLAPSSPTRHEEPHEGDDEERNGDGRQPLAPLGVLGRHTDACGECLARLFSDPRRSSTCRQTGERQPAEDPAPAPHEHESEDPEGRQGKQDDGSVNDQRMDRQAGDRVERA